MCLTRFGSTIIVGLCWLSPAVLADDISLSATRHEDYRGTPRLEFPDATTAAEKSAGAYLRAWSARYKLPADLSNLEVVNVRQSLAGIHTRYRQMLNGLPVEGAEIVISQRLNDGSVFQVYNNTYPVEVPLPIASSIVGKDLALQKAWDHLHVYGNLKTLPRAELIYMPHKTGFRLIYKTLIVVDGPFGFWEHKIDARSGEVIVVRRHEVSEKYAADDVPDFSAYRGPVRELQAELSRLEAAALQSVPKAGATSGKSTVDGTALVFDPDPRTTLANDALVDSSPAASFAAAYFTRTLRQITLDAGVYRLQGPWVSITNMASELPATAVSTTADGNWTARRGNNAFNDVMCYFHIDQNQRYLQSLGYTNAAGIQAVSIPVDSDALGGDDNSYYVPSLNYLAFGHGGVDDDEDADVILHEYGHAITYDTTPSWGGGDTGAIGEGFGDYWGASYSWTCANGSTYHPAWAFSWDGHSADSWSGRFLDLTNLAYNSSHTYVAHETIDGVANYSDQLWGAPIYQAFRDLIALGRPRTEMDRIVIESYFGVGYGVTMRDMANATVKAAMELYPAGPHAAAYYNRFANQAILLAYPLPDPTLVYPVGGELLATGANVNVQWNRNGAPSKAAASIEYNSQSGGGAAYFYDQVETGTNGWVPSRTGGSAGYIASSGSHSPTRSWYAADDSSAGDQFLARSSIAVSNGAVLSFWHSYNLESGFDGAVVEISTNGTTWVDLGTNAGLNGYNATISALDGSPIAGRRAFSGSSGGFVETKLPLAGYVGKTVSIRFRESDDSSVASGGWWVDDIKISVDAAWNAVVTTPTNTSSYLWALPAIPGSNYAVRLKLTGIGCTDSAWAYSAAFTISGTIVGTCVVTFDPQGGSVSPASATVTNGMAYGSLPTPARTGYAFGGWWTAAEGAGTQVTAATIVTVTGVQTLYAKWTANNYTVTFDVQGGTVPSPGSIIVTYGSTYGTLATTTRAGYTFGGWWTGTGGTGVEVTSATTVAITGAQTLYAKWTLIPPTVQLSAAASSVNENAGLVTITATRAGSSAGAASVNYATAGGTATAGADFTAAAGTLSWADGDGASKSFNVTLLDDAVYEGSETFTVTLSGAAGTGLGSPASETVTILDNEAPPSVLSVTPSSQPAPCAAGTTGFSVANTGGGTLAYTAGEAVSWLNIVGGGSGGNSGTITVSYDANPGAATRTGTITVTAAGAVGSPQYVTVVQAGTVNTARFGDSQRCYFAFYDSAYFAFIYDYSVGYQESGTPGFIGYDSYLAYFAQFYAIPSVATQVAYIYDVGAGRYVEAMAFLSQAL